MPPLSAVAGLYPMHDVMKTPATPRNGPVPPHAATDYYQAFANYTQLRDAHSESSVIRARRNVDIEGNRGAQESSRLIPKEQWNRQVEDVANGVMSIGDASWTWSIKDDTGDGVLWLGTA
jgi:hypothetical protein